MFAALIYGILWILFLTKHIYICIYQYYIVSIVYMHISDIFGVAISSHCVSHLLPKKAEKKIVHVAQPPGWDRVCQAEARLAQGLYPQGGSRFVVRSWILLMEEIRRSPVEVSLSTMIYKVLIVFIHPRWCRISEPSTVCYHERYP